MAQDEFPWLAASQVREPTYLDEKAALAGTENQNAEVTQPMKTSIAPSQPAKNVNAKRVTIVKPPTPATAPVPPSKESLHIIREGAMHVPVRTIPAWVRDANESDLEDLEELPSALIAHHHCAPSTQRPLLGGAKEKEAHARTASQPTSRWLSFARTYPRENFDTEIVDQTWREENDADYSKPWLEGRYNEDDTEDGDDTYRAFKKRRQVWYKRAQFTILRNPFIPLAFRLTVITFACAALGLGASIYHETDKILRCNKQPSDARSDFCASLLGTRSIDYYRDPSALMAIIVDALAMVYSAYITYDEYFSKPLGLRSARNKVRLVLLDLFFIIFQSANLSLSFSSLSVDEGACQVGGENSTSIRFDNVCDRQGALSSVLLVSLVAWLMTFSVSVLRLVERINAR